MRILALVAVMGVALAATPVTVTYYNPVPTQTDGDPLVAACGPLADLSLWTNELPVALSRDLFSRELCGQRVLIRLEDGDVVFGVVWDTMHPRFRHYVDLLMPVGERWEKGKISGVLFFWDGVDWQ